MVSLVVDYSGLVMQAFILTAELALGSIRKAARLKVARVTAAVKVESFSFKPLVRARR
jgi:hypothetical protein